MKHLFILIQSIIFVCNINGQTFHCGDSLIDIRDGKKYATILIGNQCWMKQNLNIGTIIPRTTGMTNNGIIEKYGYGYDSATSANNCIIYGGLYQWDEAMNYSTNNHGICPLGWHIPTLADFDTLVQHLGGSSLAGGSLKESGFTHWYSPNYGATNLSGFTALPGGYRTGDGYGNFYQLNYNALFWSSSIGNFLQLNYGSTEALIFPCNIYFGLSIRCVCDSNYTLSSKEIRVGNENSTMFSELYPNPVVGTSVIMIYNNSKEPYIFEIYNTMGQLVKNEIILKREIWIQKKEFSSGLYIYRILGKSGQLKVGRFEIK